MESSSFQLPEVLPEQEVLFISLELWLSSDGKVLCSPLCLASLKHYSGSKELAYRMCVAQGPLRVVAWQGTGSRIRCITNTYHLLLLPRPMIQAL